MLPLPYLDTFCVCRFPPVERMGQEVLTVENLTHGYQGSTLFKDTDFKMEKCERVALMGEPALSRLSSCTFKMSS